MMSVDKMSGVIASTHGYQKNILNPRKQVKVNGLCKHGGKTIHLFAFKHTRF